ncbi:transposase IS116/IS110/IS902 family protein [mine drainage metagenome]|uniref:Transposase IS116/IS110/IS902 family protein n=1 Tax=mine drainage metagenome TaxID=410659 RepID=T1BG30_9ZZZZ
MPKLARLPLPLPLDDRAHLARDLGQSELLAPPEESLRVERAQVAKGRKDVQFPMAIPGAGGYLANGIIAEIGDIHRFPDPEQLASYAGLASESDTSGGKTSEGRPVKNRGWQIESFPGTSVKGMLASEQTTQITQPNRKGAENKPAPKRRWGPPTGSLARDGRFLPSRGPTRRKTRP